MCKWLTRFKCWKFLTNAFLTLLQLGSVDWNIFLSASRMLCCSRINSSFLYFSSNVMFKPLIITWNISDYLSPHVFILSFVYTVDIISLWASPDWQQRVKLTPWAFWSLMGRVCPRLCWAVSCTPPCGSHVSYVHMDAWMDVLCVLSPFGSHQLPEDRDCGLVTGHSVTL